MGSNREKSNIAIQYCYPILEELPFLKGNNFFFSHFDGSNNICRLLYLPCPNSLVFCLFSSLLRSSSMFWNSPFQATLIALQFRIMNISTYIRVSQNPPIFSQAVLSGVFWSPESILFFFDRY